MGQAAAFQDAASHHFSDGRGADPRASCLQEAAALLEQLSWLPGVSGVNPNPISTADRLNHFGVSYKLRIGDEKANSRASDSPMVTTNSQIAIRNERHSIPIQNSSRTVYASPLAVG